jgi:hypothetical protein
MTAIKDVSATLPVGKIWAPRFVGVQNGQMLQGGIYQVHKTPTDLVKHFCKIADSRDSDKAALAFASRWGLLQLCVHGLPTGHSATCGEAVDTTEGYRTFSRCLDTLIRIGLEISVGRAGDLVDWNLVDSILWPDKSMPPLEINVFPPALRSIGSWSIRCSGQLPCHARHWGRGKGGYQHGE